jgi:hypothetical protein
MDIERRLSCGLKSWSEQENLLTLPLQPADKAMRALVVYSRDLSASPALPATQLGRLDYLSNMGLLWKIWIRSTGLQEKEDLSLQYEDVDADHSVVQEDTPPMKVFIGQHIQNNGKDGSSQSTPIRYGEMTRNIPSEEIVTHIFMSA